MNPIVKKITEIDIGTVLSSFIEASISTIFPLFRYCKNNTIGEMKPNIRATSIVTNILVKSVSK